MNTPILLITFNRPEHTRMVLSSIMSIQPKDLYVFQDGAREEREDDSRKCAEVQQVIKSLTAETSTRLHLFLSDNNLGCGPGPASAISWFLNEVEQGIIIEDDAVPHPDFFPYASMLLERYKDDPSVFAIGSMNVDLHPWGDGSYYFSMMNRNLCAWATWRRAWKHFDLQMRDVSISHLNKALKHYHCSLLEREYWCDRLREIRDNVCDGKSWDMQFFMSIWLNNGKGVIPNVNLSSNIGTVGEATHSMAAGNLIDSVPTKPILPITHPSQSWIQHESDKQFHFRYFEPGKEGWSKGKSIYYVLNKRLKHLLGHQGPWIKKIT